MYTMELMKKMAIYSISLAFETETEHKLNNCLALYGAHIKAYYLNMVHKEVKKNGKKKAIKQKIRKIEEIEEIEDYYFAMNVLERVYQGQEQVHSATDMRRDLGLED